MRLHSTAAQLLILYPLLQSHISHPVIERSSLYTDISNSRKMHPETFLATVRPCETDSESERQLTVGNFLLHQRVLHHRESCVTESCVTEGPVSRRVLCHGDSFFFMILSLSLLSDIIEAQFRQLLSVSYQENVCSLSIRAPKLPQCSHR